MFNWFSKKKSCKHKFKLKDLKYTGILPLEKPTNNNYEEWIDYFKQLPTHESITKRVIWPCSKCGEKFFSHYGLDILSKYESKDNE